MITYDFHGPWEDVTGPHNALYPGNRDVGPQTQLNQVRVRVCACVCVCVRVSST